MTPFPYFEADVRLSARAWRILVQKDVTDALGVVAPSHQLPSISLIRQRPGRSRVEDEALRLLLGIMKEDAVDFGVVLTLCVPRRQVVVDLRPVLGLRKERRVVKLGVPKGLV